MSGTRGTGRTGRTGRNHRTEKPKVAARAPQKAAAAAAAVPKKRRGRPPGKKTAERQIVLVRPASCPACGSTRRTAYGPRPIVRQQAGLIGETPYSHIVYRDCRCLECGKPRREAHFEKLA